VTVLETPYISNTPTVYIIVHTKDHGRYESDAMPMTYDEVTAIVNNIVSDKMLFLTLPVKGRTTMIPSEILKTSIIQYFEPQKRSEHH
jgi:hypothetical protein